MKEPIQDPKLETLLHEAAQHAVLDLGESASPEELDDLPAYSDEFQRRMAALVGPAVLAQAARTPLCRRPLCVHRRCKALVIAAAVCILFSCIAVYAMNLRFGQRVTNKVTKEYISFSWEENGELPPSEVLYVLDGLPDGYTEDVSQRGIYTGMFTQTFVDAADPDAPAINFTQHSLVGTLNVNNETDEKQDVLINGAEGYYMCEHGDVPQDAYSAVFWNNGDKLFSLMVYGADLNAEEMTDLAESVRATDRPVPSAAG